jgi:hypothetical protein
MASKNDILKQIAQKMKWGETSYYMDRNNPNDVKTLQDTENAFERFAKDHKNWGDIINAVYEESGRSFIAAPKGGSTTEKIYTVIDTKNKNNKAFDVKVIYKNNTLIIENLLNKGKKTMFEFASVMEDTKQTETAEDLVTSLIRNLSSYKAKTPKELKGFLENILKTKF